MGEISIIIAHHVGMGRYEMAKILLLLLLTRGVTG